MGGLAGHVVCQRASPPPSWAPNFCRLSASSLHLSASVSLCLCLGDLEMENRCQWTSQKIWIVPGDCSKGLRRMDGMCVSSQPCR